MNKPITITLDRERSFAWSNSAVYRLSCIQLRPKGSYATLVLMLWACLSTEDASDFPTPESFANVLSPERASESSKAISDLLAQKAGDEKKSAGVKKSPSPESSSD